MMTLEQATKLAANTLAEQYRYLFMETEEAAKRDAEMMTVLSGEQWQAVYVPENTNKRAREAYWYVIKASDITPAHDSVGA